MSFAYTISCELTRLKGLRDFIRQSLQTYGLQGMQAEELTLAVDEMVANQMIHSHQCNPLNTLELKLSYIMPDQTVIIELIDEGNFFDINTFTQPELKDIVHQKRKGGLGIRLIRTIMDKIEYVQENDKSICRMYKKMKS
ncbi:MAG TPA: ATP-binding protein [Cyclobacteriaceae bacterium]|nr:ATP-binding protein [Cyclobacteriaceae bacterium]